jgi:hypothetical protein
MEHVPASGAAHQNRLSTYNRNFKLGLSDQENVELIEYLKSL